MKTVIELDKDRDALIKQIEDIFAKGDDALTKDDLATIKTKNAEVATVDADIATAQEMEDIKAAQAKRLADQQAVDNANRPGVLGGNRGGDSATKALVIPLQFKNQYPSKAFRTLYPGDRKMAQEQAYKMGLFMLAALAKGAAAEKYAKLCKELGIPVLRAQSENVNDAGGFLVPQELDNDLIQLREEFGVVRQIFKRVVMTSDTKRRPRRTGGLTAYHLADNDAITASQKSWDSVNLTAEKIAVLTYYGNELSEDAIIDIGDDLAFEIGWAFALQEDEDGLLGDGTSKYGGFVGVCQRLIDVWTTSGGAGLIVASGSGYATSWGSITVGDLNKVKGALPRYARLANPRWVCSQEFFDAVMERLMVAAGGNRVVDVQTGSTEMRFLGVPVEIAQVMPVSSSVSTIPLLYGSFNLGADFGDRRETTIALSDQIGFVNDQMAIRGTERYAINVHDVGSTTLNPANPAQAAPQPGPLVGLITAAS